MRTHRGAWVFALALAGSGADASAHLVTTGLGPVYDGMGHLFLTPEDLLPVFAMALLAGLRGADCGRQVLFALPPAWLAGGALGCWSGLTLPAFPAPAVSFLVIGMLVAADFRLRPGAVTALAVLLGMIHGGLNGAALKASGAGFLELIGIAGALFVVVALMAAMVIALRAPWTRIAVRVAGSWIAAIGLLMLGWFLRPAA